MDEMGGDPANASAATCSRRHYERYCYLLYFFFTLLKILNVLLLCYATSNLRRICGFSEKGWDIHVSPVLEGIFFKIPNCHIAL